MNRLLIIPVIVALLAVPVHAELTLDTNCNESIGGLYSERLYNGSRLLINNTFICPNGCADNALECDSPAQPESFFAFAIVFSVAAFTLAYLGLKLGEEYKPLRFMFMAFSVAYIAFVSYIVSGFSLLTLNTLNTIMVQGYILGIFTTLGVVFYFMYLLVVSTLGMLNFKRKTGRPFKW